VAEVDGAEDAGRVRVVPQGRRDGALDDLPGVVEPGIEGPVVARGIRADELRPAPVGRRRIVDERLARVPVDAVRLARGDADVLGEALDEGAAGLRLALDDVTGRARGRGKRVVHPVVDEVPHLVKDGVRPIRAYRAGDLLHVDVHRLVAGVEERDAEV